MKSTEKQNPISQREIRVAFWWRVGFILYVLALTIATHWPHLDIGTKEYPATDKIIHLYAFGILTAILWQTHWIKHILYLGITCSMWVLLDEWTQSLPILGRSSSWMDIVAGETGVILVCVWIWVLRPMGCVANQTRTRMLRLAWDELFSSVKGKQNIAAWSLLAAAFIPLGIGFLTVWPIAIKNLPNPTVSLAFGIGLAVWIGLCLYGWQYIWGNAVQSALDNKLCTYCGESCCEVNFDERGIGICPVCESAVHLGDWLPRVSPDTTAMKRLAVKPGILGFIVLLLAGGTFLGFASSVRMGINLGIITMAASNLLTVFKESQMDFIMTIDCFLLLIAVAVGANMYRKSLARFHDEQHVKCRRCSHDLRGTPLHQNTGTCGECGTKFAKYG